jgi:DNA-binding MarR family transcriptional regulator
MRNSSADVARSVDAFRRVLRELRVMTRKTELATGLSAAQLFVLSVVAERPGCSLNEVAAATLTDRSSVAAVVDRLVEQRRITRAQSADDMRKALLTVTPPGRLAMRKAAAPPTAVLIAALQSLPAIELRRLALGLTALTKAMGIQEEPAGMLFEDSVRSLGKRRPASTRTRGARVGK